MLWLCIYLPQLPLDALQVGQPEQAIAVLDSRQRILQLSPAAEAQGLHIGMLNSTAQSVSRNLVCLPQQHTAETAALESLACWALRFSSKVSLSPPHMLVLEVGGSLKLFGSLPQLLQQVMEGLNTLAYHARLGVAPTARAAEVLARASYPHAITQQTELSAQLCPLNISALGWPEKLLQQIRAIGASTIGDCLALPRHGFNQRYGAAYGRQLDQILGLSADPRVSFQPPREYCRRLDADSEIDDSAALLPGFQRLFVDLAAQLQACGSGISQLNIRLFHARSAATRVRLGLQSPGCDPAHWQTLLQEHFQRLPLSEPVRGIELQAAEFQPLKPRQVDLWQTPDHEDQNQLLERLTARLGPSQLYGLSTCQTHAPEAAWVRCGAGQGQDPAPEQRPRPVWLLPQPVPVGIDDIQLLEGPERLQTRWWGENCQRDYYHARSSDGRRLWVFRELSTPFGWFLHGYFA